MRFARKTAQELIAGFSVQGHPGDVGNRHSESRGIPEGHRQRARIERAAEFDGLRVKVLRVDDSTLASEVHQSGNWSHPEKANLIFGLQRSFTFTKSAEAVANGDVTYRIETSTTISYTLPGEVSGGRIFARLKITRSN